VVQTEPERGLSAAPQPRRGVAAALKRALRSRFGWLVPYEARNKVLLAHTAPRLWLFERAEVRRLRHRVPADPGDAVVTVVIPTYRRPEMLAEAVRSVLDQTVRELRIIVVDDGGGLPELPEDPRITAVGLRRNIAVAGVVRNVGVCLARTGFVAFLDDDNRWEPDHLETALSALKDGDLDGVYTALVRVLPDGTEVGLLSEPFDRRTARERSYLDTNTFVARRSRALRFSRLRRRREVMPREDWELIYRFSRRHRIAHVARPTVRYLVNPAAYFTAWDQPAVRRSQIPPGD
jgi:hypothetical protein